MKKLHIAVLISGRGSNLKALIEACKDPNYPAEIIAVISNKADALGLNYAREEKIPFFVISHRDYPERAAFDKALHAQLLQTGANFVVLAGFMRLLTADFVKQWEGRMINIHPSLLPLFKGHNAHEQALAAGVKESGCTVHYVVPEMDSGPIICQARVPVLPNDTVETLSARVLEKEHGCLVEAVRRVALNHA